MTQKEMQKAAETQEQKTQKQELQKMIIEGSVVSARYGANKFDDTNKYRISLKSDNIDYDNIHAFDNAGSKLTPAWYKNRDGYINLASIYEIPIKDYKGKVISFEEWLENYNALGSIVKVAIKQKDGAIYPQAIVIIEDGEDRDPFEGM